MEKCYVYYVQLFSGLEQRFYRSDSDCRVAGKPLPEFDLYITTVIQLENKGIRPDEYLKGRADDYLMNDSKAATKNEERKPPFCTNTSPLDFSMHAFEHLEVITEPITASQMNKLKAL